MQINRTTAFAMRPLDALQEVELIEAFQGRGCQRSLETLIMAHARMVYAVVRPLTRDPVETEDFVSEGMMALIYAAGKFELDRGVRFGTYARHTVRSRISAVMISMRCPVRMSRLQAQAGASDQDQTGGQPVKVISIDADRSQGGQSDELVCEKDTPEQVVEMAWRDRAIRTVIMEATDCLDTRARRLILRHLLGPEEPIDVVAAELGISVTRALEIRRHAMVQMRASILDNGFSFQLFA